MTLRHAAEYVQELPAAVHKRPEWQIAVRILIGAAEGRDFIMHARIAILQAIVQPTAGPRDKRR